MILQLNVSAFNQRRYNNFISSLVQPFPIASCENLSNGAASVPVTARAGGRRVAFPLGRSARLTLSSRPQPWTPCRVVRLPGFCFLLSSVSLLTDSLVTTWDSASLHFSSVLLLVYSMIYTSVVPSKHCSFILKNLGRGHSF